MSRSPARNWLLVAALAMSSATACDSQDEDEKPAPARAAEAASGSEKKITFDLSGIDPQGLTGPADGKVSIHYEFCIPDTPAARAEVKQIDPKVSFSQSRGRIGCGEDELLCIGNTHQEGYREILQRLTELPYVERIDQCFWE